MRRHIWLIMIGIIVVLVAVLFWRQRSQATVVHVAEVRSAPLVAEWSAVGYVEARTAQLTAPQVGRVDRVFVHEGDQVHSGQLLATLTRRSEEAGLAAQEAAVSQARAQAASAESALREAETAQPVRERKAAAETASARERWRQAASVLEGSRKRIPAHVDAARAEVESAKANARELELGSRPEQIAQAQADLSAAEATLANARIEMNRQLQLQRENAVSRRDVDNAREALARAASTAKSRREALTLLKKGPREEQVAAAQARVRSTEANLRSAEAERADLEVNALKVEEASAALRAAEASEAETRSARARLTTLRNDARAAQARLQQNVAAVAQNAAVLSERSVYAPYDGIVGRRFVDPGDLASPTQALFSFVEAGRTWVSAEVDEQDLAPVFEGQIVVVTAPAYVGREFAGKVLRIGGEAVPQTEVRTGARIIRVRVSLEASSPDARTLLKPGMEVHISGKATLVARTLLAPSDALLTDAEGSYVWVAESNRVRRRKVRPGYVNGRETEIVSGLRAGDQVVVSGKENLREGQPVEARRGTGEG